MAIIVDWNVYSKLGFYPSNFELKKVILIEIIENFI